MANAESLSSSPGSKSYQTVGADIDLVAAFTGATPPMIASCARAIYVAHTGSGAAFVLVVQYVNGWQDTIRGVSPMTVRGQITKIIASGTTATNITAFA